MNQKELAQHIRKEFGLPYTYSYEIIQKLLNKIVLELKNENRVRLRNFGTFEARQSHGKVRAKFNDSKNIFKSYGQKEI